MVMDLVVYAAGPLRESGDRSLDICKLNECRGSVAVHATRRRCKTARACRGFINILYEAQALGLGKRRLRSEFSARRDVKEGSAILRRSA